MRKQEPQGSIRSQPRRVLAVSDWSIDPKVVAEALRRESEREPTVFSLLVPSQLPGLDWIGDPNASRPCAERQLDAVGRLAHRLGVEIEHGGVGDPERVSAIRAFLEGWSADEILLYDRKRALTAHPFSVYRYRRLARGMGRAVKRVAVPSANRRPGRRAPRCLAPLS